MADKYYYHGTKLDCLISILETKELKCRKLLMEDNIRPEYMNCEFTGYNGNNYISLCKPNSGSFNNYSAFEIFIKNHFCLILSEDVRATKTVDCSNNMNDVNLEDDYHIRFSDLKDEWQVKNNISIKDMVGIAIPFKKIEYDYYDLRKVKKLLILAKEYDLAVIDSSSELFFNNYEGNNLVEKMVINHFRNNDKITKYLEYQHKNNIDKVKEKILSILQNR